MTDCPRGDVRDLLPDLLHDRLDPRTRAGMERHLAACTNCAAELSLLRSMRRALTRTAAVDPSRVAAAVERQLARRPTARVRRHRGRDWGIAAAATLLVTGGLTMAAVRRAPERAELGTVVLQTSARPAAATGLMFDGGVGGLTNRDIEQLLQGVDSLSDVPDLDPAPVLRGIGEWTP